MILRIKILLPVPELSPVSDAKIHRVGTDNARYRNELISGKPD